MHLHHYGRSQLAPDSGALTILEKSLPPSLPILSRRALPNEATPLLRSPSQKRLSSVSPIFAMLPRNAPTNHAHKERANVAVRRHKPMAATASGRGNFKGEAAYRAYYDDLVADRGSWTASSTTARTRCTFQRRARFSGRWRRYTASAVLLPTARPCSPIRRPSSRSTCAC